ncbi:DUF4402 domain-containing protein [Flavobacterium cerinum]|uniref:DUF4402 domain-containing protein n=1 Tax=Flavobacterium cerinum TaxID=2502784 RepID=A0A444GLA2_9FLAO|nr:DUF4402 domain-containing protein [Flavobacterium cerinum]RWW91747.1 DUF4402 domain-containing protein [Flavobacterium cerinum]
MKKVIITLTFSLFGLLSTTSVFAQATASANASATIVTPISISKNTDMNFGNIATNGTVGTVVLSPASGRTFTGGVSLPATTGTVTAASFTVQGSGSYTYAITLPSSVIITSGSDQMTVNSFTSTPATTGTLSSGTQTITIGATLNLIASQAQGSYTSATPFAVTVNYN